MTLASSEDDGDDEPFSEAAVHGSRFLRGQDGTNLLSTLRCDLGRAHTL